MPGTRFTRSFTVWPIDSNSSHSDHHYKRPIVALHKHVADVTQSVGMANNRRTVDGKFLEKDEETGNMSTIETMRQILSIEQPYVSQGIIKPQQETGSYSISGTLLLPQNRSIRAFLEMTLKPHLCVSNDVNEVGFMYSSSDQTPEPSRQVPQDETEPQCSVMSNKSSTPQKPLHCTDLFTSAEFKSESAFDLKKSSSQSATVTAEEFFASGSSEISKEIAICEKISPKSRKSRVRTPSPTSTSKLSSSSTVKRMSESAGSLSDNTTCSSLHDHLNTFKDKERFISESALSSSSHQSTPGETPGWPEKRKLSYTPGESRSDSDVTFQTDALELSGSLHQRSGVQMCHVTSSVRQNISRTQDEGKQRPTKDSELDSVDEKSDEVRLVKSSKLNETTSVFPNDSHSSGTIPDPDEPALPQETPTAHIYSEGVLTVIPEEDDERELEDNQDDERSLDEECEYDRRESGSLREAINNGDISIRRRSSKPRMTMSQKAGLIFPVRHFGNKLLNGGYSSDTRRNSKDKSCRGKPMRKDMQIMLTAAMETATAHMLDLIATEAKSLQKQRITPDILRRAVNKNDELKRLLKNTLLPIDPPMYGESKKQ